MNPKLASSTLLIAPKKLLNRKQQILTKSSCFDYSLLLLERNENISSFAKMFVFPGGSVDEKVDNHWGIENQIKTGAIRELFEEAGVLLCDFKENKEMNEKYYRENILPFRDTLHTDPTKFYTMCQNFNCSPMFNQLKFYQRWITPSIVKKRFDTFFYFTFLSEEILSYSIENSIIVSNDGKEIVSSVWLSPEEALHQFQVEKKIQLAPPTFYILNELLKYNEMDELKQYCQFLSEEEEKRKGLSIMSDPTPFNTPFTQPTMIFNKEGKIKGIEDENLTPKTIIALPGDPLHEETSSFINDSNKEWLYHRIEIYGTYEYKLVKQRKSKL
ncbi:hypothetical protein ABK040_009589 [Willaertia magna]